MKRKNRSSDELRPSAALDELEAFGITFPNHRVEMWFGASAAGGVRLDYFECKPEVEAIQPLREELLMARSIFTRARKEAANRKSQAFDDNALLGIASWCPARTEDSGSRRRFARLGFRGVTFFDHIFLGYDLSHDVSAWLRQWIREAELHADKGLLEEAKTFIRSYPRFVPAEQLDIDTDNLELADAQKWPMLPFRVALNMVILTADNKVIVPLRSKQVFLGDTRNREKYSNSIGEGMAREDTQQGLNRVRLQGAARRIGRSDLSTERSAQPSVTAKAPAVPSLVALAARALSDEMGIEDQIDCDVGKDVLCVSLFFDRLEALPTFGTVLKANHTFEEIIEFRRHRAEDGAWENKGVLGLPWDYETAKGLAMGKINVHGVGTIVDASVRERIVFAQAADAFPGWIGRKTAAIPVRQCQMEQQEVVVDIVQKGIEMLTRDGWDLARVAENLGIARQSIYKKRFQKLLEYAKSAGKYSPRGAKSKECAVPKGEKKAGTVEAMDYREMR